MSDYFSRLHLFENSKLRVDVPHQSFRASVAILIRPDDHFCMIRRAVNEGDYWSGHMGFPGGRESVEDDSLIDTAIRETKEEIDVELTLNQYCGRLADLEHPRLQVSAFIFQVPHGLRCTPEESEVAEIHWLPLNAFTDSTDRKTRPATYKGQSYDAPVVHVGTADVWGLSLGFIDSLIVGIRG